MTATQFEPTAEDHYYPNRVVEMRGDRGATYARVRQRRLEELRLQPLPDVTNNAVAVDLPDVCFWFQVFIFWLFLAGNVLLENRC